MNYGFKTNTKDGITFLSVPSFEETGLCITCFSTRKGGVSAPPIDSMNLGFGRGDKREDVLENYRRMGEAAGFPALDTVAFSQVHRDGVCVATRADAGEAFLPCKREFDAVITDTPCLPIATYHADCVPVFLLDPINRAVGVAHAGWRGTAAKTPKSAIEKMQECFGTDPGKILAAIGPSIGMCCFETDSDVPLAMRAAFGESSGPFIESDGRGKFRVSLPALNVLTLKECGVRDENITVSDECTCCKSSLFWSHRASGGIRGTMAAVIMLKGE